jgi:very-short-patch-repair endonuclease
MIRFPCPGGKGLGDGFFKYNLLMLKKGIITGQKITHDKLNRAKELRRSLTPAERKLWKQLKANQLGGWHFRRQQIIDGFIVDFYCHKAGLVVEVDGPVHERQKIEDEERTQVFESRDLKVLRFTNREVMNNLLFVLKTIQTNLPPCPLPPGRGSQS